MSIPAHSARLPREQQVAPALGPVREPQRDVAQVDEQPAEAARDLDRRVLHPHAEVHRVAEAQLDHRALAGRQVDQLEAAGHELQLRRAVLARDGQVARRAARLQAGRHHDAAERDQQVVAEVAS